MVWIGWEIDYLYMGMYECFEVLYGIVGFFVVFWLWFLFKLIGFFFFFRMKRGFCKGLERCWGWFKFWFNEENVNKDFFVLKIWVGVCIFVDFVFFMSSEGLFGL